MTTPVKKMMMITAANELYSNLEMLRSMESGNTKAAVKMATKTSLSVYQALTGVINGTMPFSPHKMSPIIIFQGKLEVNFQNNLQESLKGLQKLTTWRRQQSSHDQIWGWLLQPCSHRFFLLTPHWPLTCTIMRRCWNGDYIIQME